MTIGFNFVAVFLLIPIIGGCGVKGVPLPPLNPAPIGRGEPTFSKATENVQIKKEKVKVEDDFEDEDDFTENEEKK